MDNNIGLFHFSEQNWLDTDTLGEHLLSSTVSEVTVLLLATAASSYLWFDEEHCPRNVELCTFLKSHSVNVKFVVCPTTKSARDAWEQHTPNLSSVFKDFLPETGIVDVWPDFDPDHPVEPQQIRSLVHQVRHVHSSPPRKSQDLHDEMRSSWFWNSLPIALALFALFGYLWMYWQLESLQKMVESETEKRIAALAEVKRLNQTLSAEKEERIAVDARMSSMQSEFAGLKKSLEEVTQKKKEFEHGLERLQKVVEEHKETCAAGKKHHFQALSDRIRHLEHLANATNHSQRMMTWHTCGKSCEDRAADSLLHFESTVANDDFNGGYVEKQGETCHQFQRNISHHENRPSDRQLGGIRSTFASLIYIAIVGVSNVLQTCVLQTVVL